MTLRNLAILAACAVAAALAGCDPKPMPPKAEAATAAVFSG